MQSHRRRTLLASLAFALCGAFAANFAVASDSPTSIDQQAIRDAVKLINPTAEIRAINEFGMPGVKQVLADTSVVYISDDGRYVFSGLMLDMVEKRNLSDEAQSLARADILHTIPKSAVISFEPKTVKHRITVFTDVSCHYCQMFHKDLQSYLDNGIAVDYVPFPRGGEQSPVFGAMQSIWCAADKDKKKVLDGAYAGMMPTEARCDDPVAAMYNLGDKLGIEGTPAIYDASGHHLGGYVPADQMIKQLDTYAERAKRSNASVAAAK